MTLRPIGVVLALAVTVASCSSSSGERVITGTSTTQPSETASTTAAPAETSVAPDPEVVVPEPGRTVTELVIDGSDLPRQTVDNLLVSDGYRLPVRGEGFVVDDGQPYILGICLSPVVPGEPIVTLCGPVAGLTFFSVDADGGFEAVVPIPQRLELFNPDKLVPVDCAVDDCILTFSRLDAAVTALAIYDLTFDRNGED